MATLTQVTLTCDVCGNAKGVQTRRIGLDGKTYEIDLCPKDSKGLSKAAAGYMSKARKTTASRSQGHNGHRPRSRAGPPAIGDSARASGMETSSRGHATGTRQEEANARRAKPRKAKSASKQAAKATGAQQEKGIYVYGILPADIEVAAEMPGVGEHPGLMRIVRSDDLAALISEVDPSGRLGSPDDLRVHSEILDATAAEVPVLPLRFGTVLASEEAVAGELLTAHHDEFADALGELEGRVQFVVQGRYVEEAILEEVVRENKQAARLRDKTQGKDLDAARGARTELSEIISEAVTAKRKKDTQALGEAMEGHCVASVVRKPAHELEAVHVAVLVDADKEGDVERVIADLAQDWEGRIELQLLGPMAAYDFVETSKPDA
jgi:Gas vesicle synthesis protein GvpL/GvpF/Lsr2